MISAVLIGIQLISGMIYIIYDKKANTIVGCDCIKYRRYSHISSIGKAAMYGMLPLYLYTLTI